MATLATERDDAWYVRNLHALAIAIYQAKQRNDKIGVQNLLQRFRMLADEYESRGDSDMTAFDNFILATGDWIETSVDKIPQAIAALPYAVGAGLIQGALPWALLGLGYLWFRGKL